VCKGQRSEGRRALVCIGGHVAGGGPVRGNTTQTGQGKASLSLSARLDLPTRDKGGSGEGMDAPGAVGASSLVRQGITQQKRRSFEACQDAGWLRGECQHGTIRWVRLACKRRACPTCGDHRRRLIAWRIARGIDVLGGQGGAGWFVGTTFFTEVEKRAAVKVQGKFVRWLRKRLGPELEYAATWEITRAGRLHLNLVLAPWRYVPQGVLSAAWHRFGGGKVVWIKRVGGGVGVEAAKAREGLGGYLSKWEQIVNTGRGVAWSRGWPPLPATPWAGRKGEITWAWRQELSWEVIIFEIERDRDYWREISPGEWRFRYGEECFCFERVGADQERKVARVDVARPG